MAGVIARWTYSWMDPLFKMGSLIDEHNYMDINEQDLTEKHYHMYSIVKSMYPERSIHSYLFRTLKSLLFKQLGIGILYACVSALPSYMLYELLLTNSYGMYIGFLGLLVLFLMISSLLVNKTYALGNRIVIRVYSIMQSEIMQQTIDKKEYQLPVQGELINLMNIDTKIIAEFMRISYYLISAPIQIAVCTVVLCILLGYAGLLIVGILILTVPIQKVVMTSIGKLQTTILYYTDKRISSTSELFHAIKLVKLNAWEDLFYKKINKLRSLELVALRRFKWIMGTFDVFFGIIPVILPLITLLVYLQTFNSLNPAIVFTLLSILQIVQYPIRDYPETALKYFEFKVSIRRLERYMKLREEQNNISITNFIGFKHAKLGYLKPEHTPSTNPDDFLFLLDLNIIIPPNKLTVVIGKNGSGKSLFLKALCNQVPLYEGIIGSQAQIGYVSQVPWIINDSIKNNIILDQPFDPERYKLVLDLCQLTLDIQSFPNQDESLPHYCSGGQLMRLNLARVLYKSNDMYCFDDILSSLDSITAKSILNKVILKFCQTKTTLFATHQSDLVLPYADYIVIMKDGKSIIHGTRQQLMDKLAGFDKYLTLQDSVEPILKNLTIQTVAQEKLQGKLSKSTLYFYIRSMGGLFILIIVAISDLGLQIVQFFRDIDLKDWSNAENSFDPIYPHTYLYLTAGFTVVHLTSAFLKVVVDNKAAFNVHEQLLNKCLHSKLLSLSITGTILNRFSNDMLIVDKNISNSLFSVVYFVIMILSVLVFIMVNSYWFIIAAIVIILIYYKISKFFLNTNRELKRLESSLKSPLMATILDIYHGIPLLAVYDAENYLISKLNTQIDAVNNLLFQQFMANRWLSIRSDFIGALIVLCSGFSVITLNKGTVGLVLNFSLAIINSLIWLLQHRSNLESDSCAVERIMEYTLLDQEDENNNQSANWPIAGGIKIVNLQVELNKTIILRNIQLKIKGKSKIGICGRTGSGKSTLLNTIFQLYEYSGTIFIDDEDISTLSKRFVRRKMTLIPQDPILLEGTLRDNLDLFNEYDDAALYRVLQKSQLTMKLDDKILLNGTNKSVGEKQLICLARAMLKNSKIVCIDEATANLDDHSSKSIEQLILNLKESTALCIAHKLKTIIRFDKIIVMHLGEIVEFNTPKVLLNNPNSYFLKLCKESGDFDYIVSEINQLNQ